MERENLNSQSFFQRKFRRKRTFTIKSEQWKTKDCALSKCAANGVTKSIFCNKSKRIKSFCQRLLAAFSLEIFIFTFQFILDLHIYQAQSSSWNSRSIIMNKTLYYSLTNARFSGLFKQNCEFQALQFESYQFEIKYIRNINNSAWIWSRFSIFKLKVRSNCSLLLVCQFPWLCHAIRLYGWTHLDFKRNRGKTHLMWLNIQKIINGF